MMIRIFIADTVNWSACLRYIF